MARILLIDNHDSFVHNVMQLLRTLGAEVDVVSEHVADSSLALGYDGIVLSPGPGVPAQARGMMQVIDGCHTQMPILGICLGHQALACFFGGSLYRLSNPRHGEQVQLSGIDRNDPLLGNLAATTPHVGLYHSWAVDRERLPHMLHVTSVDTQGAIMSLSHESLPLFGVQFHPEAIATDCGRSIMQNFLNLIGRK